MQNLSWLNRANRSLPPALVGAFMAAAFLVAPAIATAAPTIQTTTKISCGAAIQFPGTEALCTARVRSSTGVAAPTGTVKLTAENGQIPATCNLLPFVGPESICQGRYRPNKGGSQTVSASYLGSQTHLPSSGNTTVAVSETVTTLACRPERFPVEEPSICTAAVKNAGAASDDLSGTLNFELPRGGRLEPSSCNVGDGSVCTLKFFAEVGGELVGGLYLINATYSGDATHPGSKAQELLFAAEPTTTTIDCGSGVRFPGEEVKCLVITKGAHSDPVDGDIEVSLTAEDREVARCLMVKTSELEGTCTATFTLKAGGLQTVTASYPGGVTHQPSAGQTTVTVSDTTTRVECQPEPLAVGEASLCTAEVLSTAASDNLSGAVRFAADVDGSDLNGRFEPSGCDVSQSNLCTVKYLPEVGGQHLVTATYGGDAIHPASTSEPAALAVRGTSVKLSCTSADPTEPASCTVRVVNEGLGSRSLTGTVRFTTSNAGSFSQRECTLVPFVNEDGGICFVRYTLEEKGAHVIRAFYSGDATHPPAVDGKSELHSQFPPTTTRFTCLGEQLQGQTVTCIVTVRDDSANGATPPTGPINFFPGRKIPGLGFEEFTPCPELEPINSRESRCLTSYSPFSTVSENLTVKYPGDKSHGPSGASLRLIHPTTTKVDCGGQMALGAVTTCTATVRDADGGDRHPRGVVQFRAAPLVESKTSVGEFNRPDCELNHTPELPSDTAACSVTFKALTATAVVIFANYGGGDLIHAFSNGTTNLVVRSG